MRLLRRALRVTAARSNSFPKLPQPAIYYHDHARIRFQDGPAPPARSCSNPINQPPVVDRERDCGYFLAVGAARLAPQPDLMSAPKRSRIKRESGPKGTGEPKPGQGNRIPHPVKAHPEPLRPVRQTAFPEWKIILAILAVTTVAYLNSLDGQFVYDDWWQIERNPTIGSLANLPDMFTQSVWQFMTPSAEEPVGPYYRPIFNASLILIYSVFKADPFGWHLVSLLLSLLVTWLVYLLFRQWGMSVEISAAASLLYGLHPTHSEPIAWISSSPDLIVSAFIILTLLLYERYYFGPTRDRRLLIGSVASTALAFLTKEVAVVLPVFIFLREWLDRPREETFLQFGIRVARRLAPFVVVTLVYFGIRYAVLGFITRSEMKAAQIQAPWVLLTIPSVVIGYIRMLFVPYPLAIVYDLRYVKTPGNPQFWGSALALVIMLAAVWWLVRNSPVGRRAYGLAIIFLMPVLNLKAFNQEESLLHDRYLFLPSIGFSLLITLGIWRLCEPLKDGRKYFRAAIAVIALTFLVLTIHQNGFWQNDMVMTTNALRYAPKRPFLYNYMGALYSQKNDFVTAEANYRKALQYDPNYYDSLSNLGDAVRSQGNLAEAEVLYRKALALGAPYADTYYNLGVALTGLGKYSEAEAPLIRAIQIQSNNTAARYNLGWIYDKQGKMALAEQAYAETLQRNPAYPEPRINLAVVMTKAGRYKEAIEQLQIAQKYAPGHSVLLYALGDAYMKSGQPKEAVNPLSQLARNEPQHRLVHTTLGLCFEALGNTSQARSEFQRAIETAPEDPYTNTAREHLAKLP